MPVADLIGQRPARHTCADAGGAGDRNCRRAAARFADGNLLRAFALTASISGRFAAVYSIPGFWIGLMLILLFSGQARLAAERR